MTRIQAIEPLIRNHSNDRDIKLSNDSWVLPYQMPAKGNGLYILMLVSDFHKFHLRFSLSFIPGLRYQIRIQS